MFAVCLKMNLSIDFLPIQKKKRTTNRQEIFIRSCWTKSCCLLIINKVNCEQKKIIPELSRSVFVHVMRFFVNETHFEGEVNEQAKKKVISMPLSSYLR